MDPPPPVAPLVAIEPKEGRPAALVTYVDEPTPNGTGVVSPALRREIEAEVETLLTDGRSNRYILSTVTTKFGCSAIVVKTGIRRVQKAWVKLIGEHRDDLVREGVMRCRRRAIRAELCGDFGGASASEKSLQTWLGVAESRGIVVNVNQQNNSITTQQNMIVSGVSDDLLLQALTVLADPARRGRGVGSSPPGLGVERVRDGAVETVADATRVPPGS